MTIQDQQMVTIDRLIVDKANTRKHAAAKVEDEGLEATILSVGLILPLAVRPPQKSDEDMLGDRFRVVDGGRRYGAIFRLIAAGKLPQDYQIPIAIREDNGDADAVEVSVIANVMRAAMTPVDEVRAFRDLRASGLNPGEIAFRFGLPEKSVKARLALADLPEPILTALDEGKITIDIAKAYTLGSPEQALEVFEKGEYYAQYPDSLRRMMVGENLKSSHDIARKIGEERYLAAGGLINADLFGDDSWWISKDIIAGLKLEITTELKAQAIADGWSWAMTESEFGQPIYQANRVYAKTIARTPEEDAKLQEIGAKLEAYDGQNEEDLEDDAEYQALMAEYDALDGVQGKRAFSATQKAGAGVLIGDRLDVYEGVLAKGAQDPDKPQSEQAGDDKPAEKDPLAPSAALQERLSQVLTHSIREAILKDDHIALAFLAAVLHPDLAAYSNPTVSHIEHKGHSRSVDHAPKSFEELFADYLVRDDKVIIGDLAEHVSSSVNVTDPFLTGQGLQFKPDKARALRAALVNATGAQPLGHFDARDFFQSSSKAVIEAAMKEMGEELAPGKKDSLVNQAESFAQRYGWLPQFLRFDGYKLNKPEPKKPAPKASGAVDVTKGLRKEEKPAAKPKGAKPIKVPQEVIEVLADKVEIIDERWMAFKTQLPRDLYTKVMKVLKEFGGEWHKREQKHSFPEPIAPIIDELLLTGEYSRTKQDFGQFDTPEEIAQQAVDWADIEEGVSVLEPSAGIGRLVAPLMAKGAWVTAVEIDDKRVGKLVVDVVEQSTNGSEDYITVETDDFMTWDNGEIYHRVVMNPPFAGQADIDHVMRAWDNFLVPGGILVAIMSPSFQFRTNRKSNDFRQFLHDYEALTEEIDEGAFKESGTMIRTIMVKIRKPE